MYSDDSHLIDSMSDRSRTLGYPADAEGFAEQLASLVATPAHVAEFRGDVDVAARTALDFVTDGLLNMPELKGITREQAETAAMDAVNAPCDACNVWPKACTCDADFVAAMTDADAMCADRMEVEIDGDF
jgi:hypothetical protein